jgi:integrase
LINVFYQTATLVPYTKSKKGKWQGLLRYKDANGNWKQKSKVLKSTLKRDAQKELNQWWDQMEEEVDQTPKDELDRPLREVVNDYLDWQLTSKEIQRSSHDNQAYTMNSTVYPYIGDIMFRSLDRRDINAWMAKLFKKGLKESTVRRSYNTVRKVYAYYYKVEEIEKNPFDHVRAPKKGKPDLSFLDKEMMDNLQEALQNDFASGDAMQTAFYIALFTGMRRGEICGLRWKNIDWDKKEINVDTAIAVAKKHTYTKGPKSANGVRAIPILPHLEAILKERYFYAGDPEPGWYVVGEEDEYMDPRHLTYSFKEFCERNDITDHYGKRPTLKGLRHNFATIGVNSNVDIKSMQYIMGHYSASMTLDTYAATDPDMVRKAGAVVASAFDEKMDDFRMENLT